MAQNRSSSIEYHSIKGPKREQLTLERKKQGLSQKNMAELLNTSSATINHLEHGRMKPGLELSLKIEELFNQPFEILFPDL